MTDKQYIKKLEEALYESLALNLNWISTTTKSLSAIYSLS